MQCKEIEISKVLKQINSRECVSAEVGVRGHTTSDTSRSIRELYFTQWETNSLENNTLIFFFFKYSY